MRALVEWYLQTLPQNDVPAEAADVADVTKEGSQGDWSALQTLKSEQPGEAAMASASTTGEIPGNPFCTALNSIAAIEVLALFTATPGRRHCSPGFWPY